MVTNVINIVELNSQIRFYVIRCQFVFNKIKLYVQNTFTKKWRRARRYDADGRYMKKNIGE